MLGNTQLMRNTFQYSSVFLVLPGTGEYKLGKSWYLVLDQECERSSILAIYVENERIHAGSERKAWAADHHVAMHEAYLSIQDAAQKRRPTSQSAGLWA